jgi:hypothetical protein
MKGERRHPLWLANVAIMALEKPQVVDLDPASGCDCDEDLSNEPTYEKNHHAQ